MTPDEYDVYHEDLATGEGMREPAAAETSGTAGGEPGGAETPA
jgi:hypothetical protein